MLADGLGVPAPASALLAYLTERWDGRGPLRRAKGEEIPLPMRIVQAEEPFEPFSGENGFELPGVALCGVAS